MTGNPTPVSTYRLQIRSSFTLQDAAAITDYLHELGADWVYFSPLLKAESGSDHGYDVVDHSQIDPDRGGATGLDAAVAAARAQGMGVLIDIVPNHVGVATPAATAWWWDVLKLGRESRYAKAFDIDWDFGGGKVRLPDLGSADALSELTLELAGDSSSSETEPELELRYYDHRYPVSPGTAELGDDPVAVHAKQNYELVHWPRADFDLNYRRFFAVNSLAGIRVEVPEVFEESHVEIVRWIRDGLADGLRIDHPDGLIDPEGYLDELAAATEDTYVLVEKILEGDEELPRWKTAGTTGYDALADFDRILVDSNGEDGLTALDAQLRDAPAPDWHEMIHGTKRAVADGILKSEVLRLDRIAEAATDSVSDDQIADAIAELLACFPVYRSYLPLGREYLDEAAELARQHRPDLAAAFDAVLPILADPEHPAARRFQQTSGMVMAKGVEDQAFYRYTRLTSLTEVGADPSEFGITAERFHTRQAHRQESWPTTMTTLSTHDTKRGEDTRARISVLAEIPEEWAAAVTALRGIAPLGDGPLENLLWQAVVGAWPASRERLQAYAAKAAKEAGNSTTYTEPDEAFEAKMSSLVDSVFDDAAVGAQISAVVERVAQPGWSNSLALKLIQLTAPGVPDVYQGSELWETSLVDPDNRRAVDFDERRALLARIDGGWLPPIDETGAVKLLVASRALRLRRDRPELFTGYQALTATGTAAGHAVAFDRGGAITVATRLPIGLAAAGGWADTTLDVGHAPVVDIITGRGYPAGAVKLSELLATYPVALLIEEGSAS